MLGLDFQSQVTQFRVLSTFLVNDGESRNHINTVAQATVLV